MTSLQWQVCIVYLDDIIVLVKNFDEHIARLQKVFDAIYQAVLKIAPKKCYLFQKQFTFLGHVVSSEGNSPDPSKISAIESWPTPTNVKELKSSLGTCSYYRRFIKGFAKISKCLHRLTEKNTIFKWTSECEKAFETLRRALTSSPILIYPSLENVSSWILISQGQEQARSCHK